MYVHSTRSELAASRKYRDARTSRRNGERGNCLGEGPSRSTNLSRRNLSWLSLDRGAWPFSAPCEAVVSDAVRQREAAGSESGGGLWHPSLPFPKHRLFPSGSSGGCQVWEVSCLRRTIRT